MTLLGDHLSRIQHRVLQDALTQATAVYWRHRAAQLEAARPRPGDYHGQATTAQIRGRAAIVLFVGFAAIAEQLGLEAILGAFIAGAIISIADRDEAQMSATGHDTARFRVLTRPA